MAPETVAIPNAPNVRRMRLLRQNMRVNLGMGKREGNDAHMGERSWPASLPDPIKLAQPKNQKRASFW
jgi:hypothetical protein